MRTPTIAPSIPTGTDLLLVAVPQGLRGVPSALASLVRPRVRAKDLDLKPGSTLTLFPEKRGLPMRIIVVSLGDATVPNARRCGGVMGRKLAEMKGATSPAVLFPRGLSRDVLQALTEGLILGQWQLKTTKVQPKTATLPVIAGPDGDAALRRAVIVAGGILGTRRLANAPAAVVHPDSLEAEIRTLAELPGVVVEVWDAARLEKERMGCILAVGKASVHAPRLAIIRMYAPDPRKATVVVGKGVCFDSGGYNLKSSGSIEEMYDDMTAVATILGTLRILSARRVRTPIIAVLPIVENLISGHAYKPGDILTARNGTTIEVNNTDAEGRLILADALALVSEWKPRRIVDLATLTGAALAAVGDRFNAVLSTDDRLVDELMAAGERTFEPLWRLPLHADYATWMEGKRADLRNIARVPGLAGASMGAEFLRKFVSPTIPYAHIDLAASMQHDAAPPDVDGCNGWGVRMLADFLAKD